MYLSIVTIGFCLSYFFLTIFFSLFFKRTSKPSLTKVIFSVFLIGLLSFIVNFIFNIPDVELANRLLHALGGGFLAFFVCFLVVKNNHFNLNKIQFFFLSTLIVIALSVVNEIAEFFLQNYFNQIMASNINDTWLDLISNSIGLIVAAIILVPFIEKVD